MPTTSKPEYRKLWMFPRNIRRIDAWKLARISSIINACTGDIGNQTVQNQLYEALEGEGIKAPKNQAGVYNPGGLRTYLAQLACLGLFWKDSNTKKYEPTRAGEMLMNGQNPLAVLRCQLLRMQYPSVYGLGQNIRMDPAVQIKPFAFLYQLFNDSRLGGRLTAVDCAIPVVYAHTWKDYETCVEKILALRLAQSDLTKVITDPEDLKTPRRYEDLPGNKKTMYQLGIEDIETIGNTAKNYLQAALLIVPDGEIDGKEAFSINQDPQVQDQVKPYLDEKDKLEKLHIGYEEAWQQRYGRYDQVKAVRSLQTRKTLDPFLIGIRVAYIAELENNPFTFDENQFIQTEAAKWGRSDREISQSIQSIKAHITSVERDSVIKAALSGGNEAIKLEKAVCGLFQRLGFESSVHIGQRHATSRLGGFPDIYIRTKNMSVCGLADSKATARYGFTVTDKTKLSAYYKGSELQLQENQDQVPSTFFLYIAGGYDRSIQSIEKNLHECAVEYGKPVSAITVHALLDLADVAQQTTPQNIAQAFEQGKYYTSAIQILTP